MRCHTRPLRPRNSRSQSDVLTHQNLAEFRRLKILDSVRIDQEFLPACCWWLFCHESRIPQRRACPLICFHPATGDQKYRVIVGRAYTPRMDFRATWRYLPPLDLAQDQVAEGQTPQLRQYHLLRAACSSVGKHWHRSQTLYDPLAWLIAPDCP